MRERSNKSIEQVKEAKNTTKRMQQEELQHVKEGEGKRVKRRRADKVGPRLDGAGGE